MWKILYENINIRGESIQYINDTYEISNNFVFYAIIHFRSHHIVGINTEYQFE